jgi:predicted RNase H-like nuclease
MTSVVLGIDAAWTAHNPSGVAVIIDEGNGWRLVAAAASYPAFHEACERASTAPEAAGELLASTGNICGQRPDIVAVDMPLAHGPITGRRVSDNLISSAFGGRGAATHSPNALRPGPVGDALTRGFAAEGYGLAVNQPSGPAIIEVYPHPALIALSGSARRLPYKLSRAGKYWPELTPRERRERLLIEWRAILGYLSAEISGVDRLHLPPADAAGAQLKAFEDTLDAVICSWVGACVLEGRARAYRDAFSAVWVPTPVPTTLGLTAVGESA